MPSFQPFSSGGGQSSHLQTAPESPPLRKRENDSFASPESSLLWRHPLQPATGGLHNTSAAAATNTNYGPSSSHYTGEINFNHMSRRRGRGRHDSSNGAQYWIPYIMKGILASPVVVLTVWFMFVALHHPTESAVKTTHHYGSSRSGSSIPNPRNLQSLQQQQQENGMQAARHNNNNMAGTDTKRIPVYVPLGQKQQQQEISPVLQTAHGLQLAPQLLMPQVLAQNGHMMAGGQEQLQAAGYGNSQEQSQMMAMPSPQNQNRMAGQNMMQLSQQQQPNQQYQQQHQMMMQGQPQQMMTQAQQEGQAQMMQNQQPQMLQNQQPQVMQNQPQMIQYAQQDASGQMMQHYENQQPALTATHAKHAQNQRPAHPSKLGNFFRGKKTSTNPKTNTQQHQHWHQPMGQQPQVYYYDPAQVIVQGNQMQPTSIVYDQHGNEVQLASLASTGTQVHIEAPPQQQQAELMNSPHYGSSNSNGSSQRNLVVSSSNGTDAMDPILLPPLPLEMQIKTPDSWGESTAQDQSIIVCTVAVMALLVGALSARRLRARSFLSSCIENESLEHEVAFDNATTFSGGDSYNTFGWKGDLEKFDV